MASRSTHSFRFHGIILIILLVQASAARLGATISVMSTSTCRHINSEYSTGNVEVMCSLCVTKESCEFNVNSLSCEAKRVETNGTATTYCKSNDTVCATCVATAVDPFCKGEDGTCTCQTLCSAVKPRDHIACNDATLKYVGLPVGLIFFSCFVFVLIKCRQRYLVRLRQRALASQRRRESEQLRIRQPQLALNLVGWRDTVDENIPDLHKLSDCCYISKKKAEERIIAASAINEEPSSSMETTSTFSEVQSPRLFDSVSAFGLFSFSSDECGYSDTEESDVANTAASDTTQSTLVAK